MKIKCGKRSVDTKDGFSNVGFGFYGKHFIWFKDCWCFSKHQQACFHGNFSNIKKCHYTYCNQSEKH